MSASPARVWLWPLRSKAHSAFLSPLPIVSVVVFGIASETPKRIVPSARPVPPQTLFVELIRSVPGSLRSSELPVPTATRLFSSMLLLPRIERLHEPAFVIRVVSSTPRASVPPTVEHSKYAALTHVMSPAHVPVPLAWL